MKLKQPEYQKCMSSQKHHTNSVGLLISATELITRYYSNETLIQCCYNVGPTSATLANIEPTFGGCAVFAGKALTLNTCEGQLFLDPHDNTTICVSTQSPDERIGKLFTHRCRSSIPGRHNNLTLFQKTLKMAKSHRNNVEKRFYIRKLFQRHNFKVMLMRF